MENFDREANSPNLNLSSEILKDSEDFLMTVDPGKKTEEYAKVIQDAFDKKNFDLIVKSPKSLMLVEYPKRTFIVESILKNGTADEIEALLSSKDQIKLYLDEEKTNIISEKLKKAGKDRILFNHIKDFPIGYHDRIVGDLKIDFKKIDIEDESDLWNLAYLLRSKADEDFKKQAQEQVKELQNQELAKNHFLGNLHINQIKKVLYCFCALQRRWVTIKT